MRSRVFIFVVLVLPKDIFFSWRETFGSRHVKTCLRAYADSKDSDQTVHPSSLIRTFTARFITKTCLYNFDPLKLYFYIVKLGFTGVYINFLISAQKHRLWVFVRTASTRRF